MGEDAAVESAVGGGREDGSLGFTRIYCSPQPQTRDDEVERRGWVRNKDGSQGQPPFLAVLWGSQLSADWRPPPPPCGGLQGWGREAVTS